MSNLDKKIQIYKMRIAALIEEHADALAQAQDLHQRLQESNAKVAELEDQLRNKNVQEKDSGAIIINEPVASSKN